MTLFAVLGAIPALVSRKATYWVVRNFAGSVVFLARIICGLKVELRGQIPTGNVVIASKHQSFFDVILHAYYLKNVNFVMKQELTYFPIIGFYGKRLGVAPVRRGGKGKAVSQMLSGLERNDGDTQLVIYPQGTRVAPGKVMPYKVGAAVVCQRMNRRCILAATNVGMYWPKHSLLRKRGTVILEYLDEVPSGLKTKSFVRYIEENIENASNALIEEAISK
ncbi:1-acyl-sn-glycerol-3-phosphate acyltransferase [Amylibacter sp.]|jgi:1-acyl-sn-glycerol-3-phosphate acyltransferase|nr:1-acyl-sn-glycerol-3-phosphate acyltransferase [Amylibacter sp.]MDA9329598.1 1-acyl-sn-glycerol-3-phosphate acyltransferase [Amylibacter sp.]MDB2337408.1 1-acyl-sn-glycerol-3-phosphate acyltransferase [Amylibacter sp.]MDB4095991.1 1-acyl-sn-glycerol-3-phosphate acyltransferase [Amylibacter sp.]MDB4100188.1 1-acyl-sn-glycerol-3-phosphate acyltransferase [Amylibacter sp.]|tara:strand:+ start:9217 stop:9879 length:663 start_codon:yes stop_codon:yes gene_type:complete